MRPESLEPSIEENEDLGNLIVSDESSPRSPALFVSRCNGLRNVTGPVTFLSVFSPLCVLIARAASTLFTLVRFHHRESCPCVESNASHRILTELLPGFFRQELWISLLFFFFLLFLFLYFFFILIFLVMKIRARFRGELFLTLPWVWL